MQALFYASALFFFRGLWFINLCSFYKSIGIGICVIPSYQRIQSFAVLCSSEYEYFKEHVLNKCTMEVIATLMNSLSLYETFSDFLYLQAPATGSLLG